MENCLECGTELFGRVDKKFCNDACRNAHNNRANGAMSNNMRNINRQLAKNRKILAALNPSGKSKSTIDILIGKGYDFNLHTSMYINQKGGKYFFCYEQGFIEFEDGIVALVVKKEGM